MKKICVVSNVIGNKDVIHNGENGFVCNTVDEFVRAISEAKNEITQELSDNAYADILQQYNTKVMAQSYKNIYKNAEK